MISDVKHGVSMSKIHDSGKQDTFFNILVDFKKFNEWEFRDPLFEMNMNFAFTGMKPWDIFCQLQYAHMSQDDNDDEERSSIINDDENANTDKNSNNNNDDDEDE